MPTVITLGFAKADTRSDARSDARDDSREKMLKCRPFGIEFRSNSLPGNIVNL